MLVLIGIVLHVISILVNPLVGVCRNKLIKPRVAVGYICSIAAGVLYFMAFGWIGLIIQPCITIPMFCLSWGINKYKRGEIGYQQLLLTNEVICLNESSSI